MRNQQQGMASVEFTIVATLMFIAVFAVIEFGRVLWTWGTLAEATRRGARTAAVCPPPYTDAAVDDASIVPRYMAVFQNENGVGNSYLPGFTTNNVSVQYFDSTATGAPLTPNCADQSSFSDIKYVKVSIQNYQTETAIPLLSSVFTAPNFETTLRVENLGVIPGAPYLQCFGKEIRC